MRKSLRAVALAWLVGGLLAGTALAQEKAPTRSRGCAAIADPAQKDACQKQLERKAQRAAARKAEADRIAQACASAVDKAGCANDERAKMRAARKAKAKAKGKEKEK
jgi:hypothetical protein